MVLRPVPVDRDSPRDEQEEHRENEEEREQSPQLRCVVRPVRGRDVFEVVDSDGEQDRREQTTDENGDDQVNPVLDHGLSAFVGEESGRDGFAPCILVGFGVCFGTHVSIVTSVHTRAFCGLLLERVGWFVSRPCASLYFYHYGE